MNYIKIIDKIFPIAMGIMIAMVAFTVLENTDKKQSKRQPDLEFINNNQCKLYKLEEDKQTVYYRCDNNLEYTTRLSPEAFESVKKDL